MQESWGSEELSVFDHQIGIVMWSSAMSKEEGGGKEQQRGWIRLGLSVAHMTA